MKILFTFLLTIPFLTNAQELIIVREFTDDFPDLSANYLIVDENFEVNNSQDVNLTFNNQNVDYTLNCPPAQPEVNFSSVLTIDVSSSMRFDGRLELAKKAAFAWLEELPINSECAITSFSDDSYINMDFTRNQTLLNNAIESLTLIGGTNYSNGIYNQITSATEVLETAEHKPVIVLLTDGFSNLDIENAKAEIDKSGAQFYAISLLNPLTDELKELSSYSGGISFENVKSEAEIISIYKAISYLVKGGKPCTISWRSDLCQLLFDYELSVPTYGVSEDIRFAIESNYLPSIIYQNGTLSEHGIIESPNTSDIVVQIEAFRSDIRIESIKSDVEYYQIIDWGGSEPPFTLEPGQTRNLTVRYTPENNNFTFATFEIESNACDGNFFFHSGGDNELVGSNRKITLTQPNGGERFEVGSQQEMNWVGLLPDESICLDYSIDGGKSWLPLGNHNGSSFDWEQVPNTPSESCLARIVLTQESIEPAYQQIITDGRVNLAGEMVQDELGNIIFAGYYYDKLRIENGEPPPVNPRTDRIFLVKFDSDLNVLWFKSINISDNCVVSLDALTVDQAGNIYIGGNFRNGEIILENNPNLNADIEVNKLFLIKYNATGNEDRAISFEGSLPVSDPTPLPTREVQIEKLQDIKVDEFGFVYLSGVVIDYFSFQNIREKINDFNFDSRDPEFFIAKLDNALNYVSHAHSALLNCEDSFLSLNNGKVVWGLNYIAEGFIEDSFGTRIAVPRSDNTDCLLVEFNDELELQVVNHFTARDRLMIADLQHNQNGDLHVFGSFVHPISWNNNEVVSIPENGNQLNSFIIKFNGNAESINWYKSFGGNGFQEAISLSVGINNRILLSGFYEDDFSIDEFDFTNELLINPKKNYVIGLTEFGEIFYTNGEDKFNNNATSAPYEIEYIENGYILSGYFVNEIFENPRLSVGDGNADIYITKQAFRDLDCWDLSNPTLSFIDFYSVENQEELASKGNEIIDAIYDNQGFKYLAGRTEVNIRLGEREIVVNNQNGSSAFYVAKFSKNNELIWLLEGNSDGYVNPRIFDLEIIDDRIILAGGVDGELIIYDGTGKVIDTDLQNTTVNLAMTLSISKTTGELLATQFDGFVRSSSEFTNQKLSKNINGNIFCLIDVSTNGEMNLGGELIPLEQRISTVVAEYDKDLNLVRYYNFNSFVENQNIELTSTDIEVMDNGDILICGNYRGELFGISSGSGNTSFLFSIDQSFQNLNWFRKFETGNGINFSSEIELFSNGNLLYINNVNGSVESFLDNGASDISENIGSISSTQLSCFNRDGELIWYDIPVPVDGASNVRISSIETTDNNFLFSLISQSSVSLLDSELPLSYDSNLNFNRITSINAANSDGKINNSYYFYGETPLTPASIDVGIQNIIVSGLYSNLIFLEDNTQQLPPFLGATGFFSELKLGDSENIYDISDSFWEIFENKDLELETLEDVSMGLVAVGSSSFKIMPEYLRNLSDFEISINNVNFPDEDVFSILSFNPASNISTSDASNFEFAFAPDAVGSFESRIIIETSHGTDTARIFGDGFDPSINVITRNIDFGQVEIFTDGRNLITDILSQNGLNDLVVDSKIIGPDTDQFFLNEISTNLLPPNEILLADIDFRPTRIGRTSSILSIVNEANSLTFNINLYGEGIDLPTERFKLYTDFIESEVGERISIPIKLDNSEEALRRNIRQIYTELSFNESLAYPLDESNKGEAYGRVRTIPLTLPLNFIDDDIIAEIPIVTTLGDSSHTELKLERSIPLDSTGKVVGKSFIDNENGELHLTDICFDGGARFLTGTSKFTLSIVPNPVSEEALISFGIIESSNVQIEVYDMQGNLIQELVDEFYEYGFYEEEFDMDFLNSGSYLLAITTISGRVIENFQVTN